jgi:hypothetical protein
MQYSTCPKSAAGWLALFIGAVALFLSPVRAEEPGQTPRPTSTEPVREPPEEELVKLDKGHPYFKDLEFEGPFEHRGFPITDPKKWNKADAELKAYDYVLAFAKEQPVERMKKYAVRNVPVENLFRRIKQDYMLELLHFEGKLKLVLAMKPTPGLEKLEQVKELYEAWLYPRGSNKLVCVVVSELPEGIKVGEDQSAWVAFDAYYFRLFHYESRAPKDRTDPEKKQWHEAPMFLGRTFEVLPPEPPAATYNPTMLIGIATGLGLLAATGFILTLWFRRGDRRIGSKARERIHESVLFENTPDSPGPMNRISE